MKNRDRDLSYFLAFLAALLLLNYVAQQSYLRLDLTEDQRFTLASSTKKTLDNLNEPVEVEIYLDGSLNAEFQNFQERIREILQEFQGASDGLLRYRFFDPNSIIDPKDRAAFLQSITEKGLPVTTLFDIIDGERKESNIFPGGIIRYRDKEETVLLLKGNKARSSEEQLTQSIEGLEYELISVIQKLTNPVKKRIAYIQGHGSANAQQTIELDRALSESFEIAQIALDSSVFQFDALLFPRPRQEFSDRELFFLDQYLVQGGAALFLLDPIQMNIDSIPIGGTYAFPRNATGLEDILFRMGARVSNDLIQDLQASRIEIITGKMGDKNNVQYLPWPYYIYLNRFSNHPIVRNLDVVLGRFISTVDTVRSAGIQKTALLYTSDYSRIKEMPGRVSLDEIREISENRQTFNQQNLPVAWLLEGQFPTGYQVRFPPKGISKNQVKTTGEPARVIVVGDGDLIINQFDKRSRRPMPIDYDPYTRQTLSNVEFIRNALNYLTDVEGIITSRRKTITQRPLDRIRAREEGTFWQILNVGLPVVLLILFGIGYTYFRKKKYVK